MDYQLERLKKFKVFMQNLRFDVTPEVIFKPRFITNENECDLVQEIQGFSFYIDYLGEGETPALMIMKNANLTSKTIGEIPEAPEDLLLSAVKRQGIKDYAGMYPIDEGVESWLKEKLGLG